MAADPILISGAGPAGLVLALSLAKHGVPIRVIDKELGPKPGERGVGIKPRSLEVHRLLGTLPDILSRATGVAVLRQYDLADPTKVVNTTVLMPTLEPTPQTPYVNPILLGQPYQEQIFASHLQKLGVSIEFGSELRSFEQTDDCITGEIIRCVNGEELVEEFKTPWLIGADGAHSVVRKTLGLSFLGETREGDNFVLADVKIKGEKLEFWERWGEPTTKMAHLRPSGQDEQIASLIMAGPQVDAVKVSTNRETIIEGFYDITGRHDIIIEDVIWSSRYRPNIRMVDQFRVGRVFLVGDAAHCHSPAGGQGLNSGIQDSFNLGWKLALVHKGFSLPTLLDTYAEERLPIIAEMLGKTTELWNKVRETNNVKRGGELNQLGVNYRGSSLVYEDDVEVTTTKGKGYNDDSEVAARPGDRAPDAPGLVDASDKGKTVSIYDVFSATAHTILVFSDTVDGHSALFHVIKHLPEGTVRVILILPKGNEAFASNDGVNEQFDRILVDNEDYAYAGYHIDQASLAIIRPDGVVGARILGVSGVEQYFKGIFS